VKGLSHPEWLGPVALVSAAIALGLLLSAWRAGRRRHALLGAGPPLPGLGRDLLLLVALAAVGVALLGPRVGYRSERVTASGVDLVLLLDVSRSMDARDVVPSRLDRARRSAELVLLGLEPGDRVALAAYAGRGVLLTPLTADRSALLDLLPSVDSELMRLRGSDLPGGVRAGLAAFEAASLRPRVLLVLGDGEDPARSDDVRGVAAQAAREDVRILAVGIGSEAGSTVPDHGAPLRDATGEIVRTRRDLVRLGALAEGADGRILPTDDFGAFDPAEAVREIRRDAAGAAGEMVERRVPAVRVAPFAALAFALLAAELVGCVWRRSPPTLRHVGQTAAANRRRVVLPAVSTLLCVVLAEPRLSRGAEPEAAAGVARLEAAATGIAGLEAAAARAPRDPAVLVRLGLARARAGLGPEAQRAFLAAALYARDPALASLAYFDLGVSALERGELEAARDAFFDALALSPRDGEARFNLEWTLHALQEGAAPPPGGEHPSESKEERPGTGSDPEAAVGGAPASGDGRARGDTADDPSGGASSGAAEGSAGPAAHPEASPAGAAEERGQTGAPAQALDAGEITRWLHAVQDDPGRGLRDAARRAGGGERPSAQGPGW
jgi:Ca-activated chloride channel family protein